MDWHQHNDQALEAALARVRGLLEGKPPAGEPAREGEPGPPALEILAERFGLSPFERDVLVLAAGPELDPGFGALCAAAAGEERRGFPCFALALACFPEAHWSALSPAGPLRRWRLLEVGEGGGLTAAPLRIEERVLHFLRGLDAPEERLAGVLSSVTAAEPLVGSHRALAERLAGVWAESAAPLPAIVLCGAAGGAKRAVAAAVAERLGMGLMALPAAALPAAPADLDGLARLLNREAALDHRALLVEAEDLDVHEPAGRERERALGRLAEELRGPLFVAVGERRRLGARPVVPVDVAPPTPDEQLGLWSQALGPAAARLDGELPRLAANFRLDAEQIRSAAVEVGARLAGMAEPAAEVVAGELWRACLGQARPGLEALAQRIAPRARWDELVLPAAQHELLRALGAQVRHRHKVYGEWGFEARSARGLGISALFSGPSGTGKTMAAEVLAGELGLDLYRIDLASVVSKYIGETEKNLKKIFDAAEAGGAVLLFDEADALFGKRSEVKDSHDRYANIEVGYLLQRMEAYRGLAILTTNAKGALDPAFIRRLRFIVSFPFPDAEQRAEIWRRIFPVETPIEGLSSELLARLDLAGGNIRNVALGAAFLAAETGGPVRMEHVVEAARGEYAKLERPFPGLETGGRR